MNSRIREMGFSMSITGKNAVATTCAGVGLAASAVAESPAARVMVLADINDLGKR